MIDKLIGEFLNSQEKISDDYLRGITRRVEDVLYYSNLPERYLYKCINEPYSNSLSALRDKITNIINNDAGSVVVRPSSFKYGGYITATLLYRYLLDSLKADTHIRTVLYIDTNIFMEDLKRFMNKDEFADIGLNLEYSLDVLFKFIYEADFVFWDNFNLVDTNYEVNKLYEIFSRRYMHLKGNIIYLCANNKADLTKNFDVNLRDMMDLTEFYDLSKDKYSLVDIGG